MWLEPLDRPHTYESAPSEVPPSEVWVLYELTEAEQHVIHAHLLAGSHLRGRGKPQAFITDVSQEEL